MILHIWMHWFWITSFIRGGLLLFVLRNLMCSSSFVAEAGLLGTSFLLDSDLSEGLFDNKEKTSQKNVVDNMKKRWKRSVEDEENFQTESPTSFLLSPENETVSLANNETASNADKDSVYHGIIASDMDDTYNGGNLDMFQYPLKKYSKYANIYAKYKMKSKSGEDERDTVKVAEEKFDVDVKRVSSENGNNTKDREIFSHLNGTQTVLNSTLSSDNDKIEKSSVVAGNSLMTNETESLNRTVLVEGMVNVTEDGDSIHGGRKDLNGSVVNVTEEQKSLDGESKKMNLNIENKVDESSAHTTVEPFFFNNRVAAATSSESRKRLSQPTLDAGSITGITLGIIVVTCFVGAISFLLYRRRYLNKPQALNDKCSNLDSSGYIDDTSLRENSEEMYSLDNDSFLNSLEAMTIQNYWTENVKHTKL